MTSNEHAVLHKAMKQYMELVYSSRNATTLNDHVNISLMNRKKCGYSMRSEGVGNQSKKNFEMKETNTTTSGFPHELTTSQYNDIFPNDKRQLKNNEYYVGKGGQKLNNGKLCSKKSVGADWSSTSYQSLLYSYGFFYIHFL